MTTADVMLCSVCRGENPTGARFCNVCGSRLAGPTSVLEERKVVTALFCDLVGFTASSEGADPEDVDRMLSGYESTVRGLIESHGGVVEKFIGDAVVGIFGIPATHEDDPERAVRAALRITADAATLPGVGGSPLRLRVGVNTGEALVRLDVSPAAGDRFVTGDTINTASRIQSVAPEMGVAVGLATWEATKRQFEYAELPPATLKGKAEPVRVYQPIAPRARLGSDLSSLPATRLVGRDAEFGSLRAAFDGVVATRSMRFVTVSGAPGMGKSRLVGELLAYVDAQPVLVTWRQGRCLPYENGISFWALGEILKSHAGILESDAASIAIEKLDQVLPEGDERAWLRDRLLPLLGIETGPAADRAEQFEAWRRFLEQVSAQRPTVLVFEDLHWADEAMLRFLEELVSHDPAVPMLVVGTARPELFAGRAGFPGPGNHAVRIDLASLDDEAAAVVAGNLLADGALAPDILDPIIDRAAGNPLFVEEFVRLLIDRDLLANDGGILRLREGSTLPVPESISALLAARLDALPPEWKSVLGDASVIGKVFWAGALAAMGDRSIETVRVALEGLVDRELVRPAATASVAGEDEYSFWHVLGRDVAYAALPRAARGTRHVAAARWIEDRAGDRLEDAADVLAHHYRTALALARATGNEGGAVELQAPALRFLSLAGERAMGLDAAAALGHLEAALEIATPGHPERRVVLDRYGQALHVTGRFEDSVAAFEEAIAGHLCAGDALAAGSAMLDMAEPRRLLGRHQPTLEARTLLEPLGPSVPLARGLLRLATGHVFSGRQKEGMEEIHRAVAMLDAVTSVRPVEVARLRARALALQGLARAARGDPAGIRDMRAAIAMSMDAGDSERALGWYSNCSIYVAFIDGPLPALDLVEEALAVARARGMRSVASTLEVNALHYRLDAGQLDAALRDVPALESRLEAEVSPILLAEVRSVVLRIIALRGLEPDERILEAEVAAARADGEPDLLVGGLGAVALVRQARGEDAATRALLSELVDIDWGEATGFGARLLPGLVRSAVAAGDAELAAKLGNNAESVMPFGRAAFAAKAATLLEARGALDEAAPAHARAATAWARLGVEPERAESLLAHGRTLVRLGRQEEARPVLAEARSVLVRLGALPAIAELDALAVG